MRRLIALAAAAAALSTGGPATAAVECVGVQVDGGGAGVCVRYVCVDICAPEVHVDPYCTLGSPPAAQRLCAVVDAVHVVVP